METMILVLEYHVHERQVDALLQAEMHKLAKDRRADAIYVAIREDAAEVLRVVKQPA